MFQRRTLLTKIEKHLSNKLHTIITGARQVGKTSLLKMLFKNLRETGELVFLLTLEDGRILHCINEHPNKIFDFIPEKPLPILEGEAKKRLFLLIDEVQYADNPTNFLKYLYDRYEGNIKVIATGSSAFYIDRKFKDSLAGRKRIFNLYPLSFKEFLEFNGANNLLEEIRVMKENPNYRSLHRASLEKHFLEFITFGGYPAIALEKDIEEKKLLLEELKNAYVKRDMLESGVSKENKFFLLLQLLADQAGNLLNMNELAGTLQVDAKTINYYIYVLEKCFHVHLVRPFYRNLRKELTKMPKIYFNDLGLRNVLLNRFEAVLNRADKGQLLENHFFCQFRQIYSSDQIKFWRTADKQEVDFVIEESFEKGKAFEVKWNKMNFKPGKYKKFSETYPSFILSCLGYEDFYLFE